MTNFNSQVFAIKTAEAGSKAIDFIYLVVFLLCMFFGFYMISDAVYIYSEADTSRVQSYKSQVLSPENGISGVDNKKFTEDVIGWLEIYDTTIDYPLMHGKDNSFYVNHDAFGDFSLSGAIFLDCSNKSDLSDKYNLIYGHHMQMEKMFGCLDRFLDDDYSKKHNKGCLTLKDDNVTTTIPLSLVAVVPTDMSDYVLFNIEETLKDPDAIDVHIKDLAKNTYDSFDATDRYVALSTCSEADGFNRLVVIFKVNES